MAPPSVSTTLGFVRKHPVTLCCLVFLLFMHPLHHLLLFFGPLLISTAIFVVAMIGWGPDPTKQNKSSQKNAEIVEKWAVGLSEESKEEEGEDLERYKTCNNNVEGDESSIGEGERCGEAAEVVEGRCRKADGEGMKDPSAPSSNSEDNEQAGKGREELEPDPGLQGGDGGALDHASSAEEVASEQMQARKEEGDAAAEERDAKLVRAVERELAILAASLSKTQSLNARSPSSVVQAEN